MSISIDTLVLGLVTGLTYGLLALGLSLIYKSARFVNFAHGNLGALAAVLFAKLVLDLNIPFWVSFVLVVAGAAALSALVELTIVRRLFAAPRLVLVVATIALSQLFLFVSLQRGLQADQERLVIEGYPIAFDAQIQVGSLLLRGADIAILFVAPLLALGLAAFFRYSPYGQAIRAAAENTEAARLSGISAKRMSTIVWIIAGILAAVTGILLAPRGPVFAIGALGPSILVRALGASLIGRMTNLPVAFGAGIGIGIIETVAFANFQVGGIQDLVVFLVVAGALVFRARDLSRAGREEGGVVFGAETTPVPADVAALPKVRLLRKAGVYGGLALAIVLPLIPGFDTSEQAFLLALVCGYAMVGISISVLTGWAGQVSLGQIALVGAGAFATARFADRLPLPLLVLVAGLAGMVVAVIVGLPAVRIQGLFLAVSTLAFAVVAEGWAFQQEFVGDPAGVFVARSGIFESDRAVYYGALGLLVLVALGASNLRRSGPGRMLIAVRDNDRAARSQGVSAVSTRLLGFALSGFAAGMAGVVFAYARQNFTATAFPPAQSLEMLLMVIIGGLGSIPGAILGAVLLFGVPALFGGSELIRLLTGALGVLIVLLFFPGGLISAVHKARDTIIARIVRHERGLPAPPAVVPPLRDLWDVARGRQLKERV